MNKMGREYSPGDMNRYCGNIRNSDDRGDFVNETYTLKTMKDLLALTKTDPEEAAEIYYEQVYCFEEDI